MAEFQSPAKKPKLEFDDIASIDSVSDGYGAKVHGVVTSVSPLKGQRTKFFDGVVSDGKKKLRFIGFNESKGKLLEEYSNDHQAVTLTNCCVKNAKYGGGLEIIVGDGTTISKSDKQFSLDEDEMSSPTSVPECKEITINQLQNQVAFQKVLVAAKVIEAEQINTLSDGRRVRNVVISDSTDRAKLSLWEDNIELVESQKSYRFINLMVKAFNDKNTLFTPRNGLLVEEIENIDKALPPLESSFPPPQIKTLTDATVVGVSNFTSGYICLNCNKSIIQTLPDQPTIAKCKDCNSMSNIDSCKYKVTASLLLSSNKFHFRVLASDIPLGYIANKPAKEVTEYSLLFAPSFHVTFTTNNMTITSVSRPESIFIIIIFASLLLKLYHS